MTDQIALTISRAKAASKPFKLINYSIVPGIFWPTSYHFEKEIRSERVKRRNKKSALTFLPNCW